MKTIKKIANILLISIIGISIISCSTVRLTIQGTPGTKILNSSGELISTIDNSGKTTIIAERKLNKVFLSQAPGEKTAVPFVPNMKASWSILPTTKTNNDIVSGLSTSVE